MSNKFTALFTLGITVLFFASCGNQAGMTGKGILFKDVTLIDGNSGTPLEHTDLLIQADTIASTGKNLDTTGLTVINLSGRTIMPALISTHVHVGTLKGTTTIPANYTRENILRQLKQYQNYGVGTVVAMGTDRPILFSSGLRDSSMKGLLPGARLYSAGYGFGVPQGAPPLPMAMDNVYRPTTTAQAKAQIDSLALLKPTFVKMWVDDFGGKFKKMDPAIYKSIITAAHQHDLRVVAHAYYLSDARRLVADGVDVIGHSIRDSVIDDQLIVQMKAKKVTYIPTLSLDEFAYIYARKPEWMDDDFFKKSLEPGVYEMISSAKYQNELKNSPAYAKNVAAFQTALKNLKKLYDAGVFVSMGTDSGAMPLRAQGFSEHLEMELMVQAGLTPLQAIGIATKNGAQLLKTDQKYGTLEKGKIADFIILSDNPLNDIRNTRKIQAVYKAGKEVSKGPLH
ncbi:amidohydrolase family protein [Pedobacter sp. MR2016-24]|uniref:amidohydrolase family protein n=1 Tax=Pedobacter sp. MR2016-24 TaxID=2994466 RepID=UPI002247BF26|nr:amidohydrolase family protein [Pedobacter sp. MR2016-24]MCX2484207.1 amidohydrolase family protein [Pedobacter sp. MR2016-24]